TDRPPSLERDALEREDDVLAEVLRRVGELVRDQAHRRVLAAGHRRRKRRFEADRRGALDLERAGLRLLDPDLDRRAVELESPEPAARDRDLRRVAAGQ